MFLSWDWLKLRRTNLFHASLRPPFTPKCRRIKRHKCTLLSWGLCKKCIILIYNNARFFFWMPELIAPKIFKVMHTSSNDSNCRHGANEDQTIVSVLVGLAATRNHYQWFLYLEAVETDSVFDSVWMYSCIPIKCTRDEWF